VEVTMAIAILSR